MPLGKQLLVLLAAGACFACDDESVGGAPPAGDAAATCDSLLSAACWAEVKPAGSGVFPDEWTEGKFPQALIPVVAWDGAIWMINESYSWSSPDGLSYSKHDKTDWAGRLSPNYAFFRDRIWVVGGMELDGAYPNGTFTNVVWSSADGITWTNHGVAAFPPRKSTALAVYQDKLWLFGGADSIAADGTNARFLNDVWSSADGIAWTLVTASAPWSPRADAGVEVLGNALYVVGGAGHNDVWRSRDGIEWTQSTPEAQWNVRHDHGTAAFDGKLWVFGGWVGDHRNAQNDVWYSFEGANWARQGEHAPWTPRSGFHHAVIGDKLWIFSGKHTGSATTWPGDIWALGLRAD
jgi:hypothetical protein